MNRSAIYGLFAVFVRSQFLATADRYQESVSGQGMTNQAAQWTEPGVYEFTVACGNILTGRVTVVAVDLDVDSDNNNGLNPDWTRTAIEESMEDDVNYPGKLVLLNDGDADSDGVPNFADGFNIFGNEGTNAGGQFTPLVLEVPESVDPAQARVRFTYSCSDPALVQRSGDGSLTNQFVYTPAPGHLRLWTKDGSVNRSVAEVDQSGGHFVKTGSEYLLQALGINRTIPLWVEGIAGSATNQRILVELDPYGGSQWQTVADDAVRVSVVHLEIAPNPGYALAGTNSLLNVTFALTNSFAPGGVTWMIEPAGLEGGASLSNAEDSAVVSPGIVLTNYVIRAAMSADTNFYTTAALQILNIGIAMDANRDLNIDFNGTNDIGQTNVFWINDDYDVRHWEENAWHEDDAKLYAFNKKDCDDDTIGHRGKDKNGHRAPSSDDYCLRDLEDFTVVQLKVPGIVSNLTGITYWLGFDSFTGNPGVNLFKAITNGVTTPFGYLTNALAASNQVKEIMAYTVGTDWQEIGTNHIDRYDQPIGFLLEGKTAGKGDFTFVVMKDGQELCRSSVSLELHPITDFYDIFKINQVDPKHKTKWEAEVQATATQVQPNTAYTAESDKYLLLVHGWNMV